MPETRKYGTIITEAGAALIADCILQGTKLPITQAAAGDGGGCLLSTYCGAVWPQKRKVAWRDRKG